MEWTSESENKSLTRKLFPLPELLFLFPRQGWVFLILQISASKLLLLSALHRWLLKGPPHPCSSCLTYSVCRTDHVPNCLCCWFLPCCLPAGPWALWGQGHVYQGHRSTRSSRHICMEWRLKNIHSLIVPIKLPLSQLKRGRSAVIILFSKNIKIFYKI